MVFPPSCSASHCAQKWGFELALEAMCYSVTAVQRMITPSRQEATTSLSAGQAAAGLHVPDDTYHCLQDCHAEGPPLHRRWQSWCFVAQMTALEQVLQCSCLAWPCVEVLCSLLHA